MARAKGGSTRTKNPTDVAESDAPLYEALAFVHGRLRHYGLRTEVGLLAAGNARANEVADATLTEVRAAMGMVYDLP